jgi:hypothetical protein
MIIDAIDFADFLRDYYSGKDVSKADLIAAWKYAVYRCYNPHSEPVREDLEKINVGDKELLDAGMDFETIFNENENEQEFIGALARMAGDFDDFIEEIKGGAE